MALYYGLLRLWVRLGTDESTVRLLSVLPDLATVPVLYVLENRFGTRVGLSSALLLAINGYNIQYAQEARSYSLDFFVRYFIIVLPPLLLLAAIGISQIEPRVFRLTLLALIVGFGIRADAYYYRDVFKDDWRGATQYVISGAHSGDAVLFRPASAHTAYDYYRNRFGFPGPTIIRWPSEKEPLGGLTRGDVDALASRYERISFVLRPSKARDDVFTKTTQASLMHKYSPSGEKQFYNISVLLCHRKE
jgi:hypothetical protein